MYGQLIAAVNKGDADDLRRVCRCYGSADFVAEDDFTWANTHPAPVELACKKGESELVRIFLENGCSPNLPTSHGRLVHSVMEAMKSQAIEIGDGKKLIELMLSRDLQLTILDAKGNSTLQHAAELGDLEILELIIKHSPLKFLSGRSLGCGFIPLHTSVMKGDVDCVEKLVQSCPPQYLNLPDGNCETAVSQALKMIRNNVKYLLVKDGIISVLNNSEQRKLYCHQCSFICIVEMLLGAGADPNSNHPNDAVEVTKKVSDVRPLSIALDIVSVHVARYANLSMHDHKPNQSDDFLKLYQSIVRLMVQAGATSSHPRMYYHDMYRDSPVVQRLVGEIFDFWTSSEQSKVPKLTHLCRQIIRIQLRKARSLHCVQLLPLPPNLKEYVNLSYF